MDKAHERRKDFITFVVFVSGMIAIAEACLAVVLLPAFSDDMKTRAMTVLTAIAAGAVGYLSGKVHK